MEPSKKIDDIEQKKGIFQDFGLTKKDIILLILTVVISVGTSILIFNYQVSTTTNLERKNLAIGYLADIEMVNQSLISVINGVNDPNDPDYGRPRYLIRSIYPDYGLYHSNKEGLNKFDPELSYELYGFYNEVLDIEEARNLMNSYDQQFPMNSSSPVSIQNHLQNRDKMYQNIIKKSNDAYAKIPQLKSKLEQYAFSLS